MTKNHIYEKLAKHLNALGMGYPLSEDLEAFLCENFSPEEARVALALPVKVIPLQPVAVEEIMKSVDLPEEELVEVLEDLASKGLIFSGTTEDGRKGYALQQLAFGFPQAYFWKGEDTSHARKMADQVPETNFRQLHEKILKEKGLK